MQIDITIGGTKIHTVTIVNLDGVPPYIDGADDAECHYEYVATYNAERHRRERCGAVTHRRSMGAYDLAATVLAELRGVKNTRDASGHGGAR